METPQYVNGEPAKSLTLRPSCGQPQRLPALSLCAILMADGNP